MTSLSQRPACQHGHGPTWALWVLALPLALTWNLFGSDWDQLVHALLTLVDAQADPSRFQLRVARITAHTLIPTLLAFCLLRFTRLGSWLAPNRLALGAFMLLDFMLIFVGAHGVYMVGVGRSPYLSHVASAVLSPIAMACLILGTASLALSTFWHRTTPHRRLQAFRLLRWLWREV